MLRMIFALLASVAMISASAVPLPTKSIKVSGEVMGISDGGPRTLIINECDVSSKSARCIVELDSAGRFDVNVPFYYGHTFTVNYNRTLFINAYAEPGDSVFVNIDASESPVGFHVSGDHARLNEEYSHAVCDLAPLYSGISLLPDTVALSVYMPAFKSEVSRIRDIVDRYVTDYELSAETTELLHLDNIFIPANMAIGFRGRNDAETIAFFTDSLFDIFNERNTRVMIFPYHLSALMYKFPDYVERTPRCIARDLMYASSDDIPRPERSTFTDTAYYDRVYGDTAVTVDFSTLNGGKLVVMENDTVYNVKDANPVGWLTTRYASRPVYVDVSASWCGPCRASLAAGEDVRRHFSNDVVFAVLWLRSDMDTWSTLAPAFRYAVHIFVPDDDMSNRIMAALNIQGFPTYFFISSDGEISIADIPHFNDPALVEFLRSHTISPQ